MERSVSVSFRPVHVLKCCSCLNTVLQLKPKLNNAETKKPFHEFSVIKKAGAALVRTINS